MIYNLIKKNLTEFPPKVSSYQKYKPYLRKEADHRCVYCGIHENPLGGYDYFHVEHYRPKSVSRFKRLEKDFYNLFYACAICNRFKSNDWPNDPIDTNSVASYPDPSKVDYNTIFDIHGDGTISGNCIASKYMVERIHMNRPQLIHERRDFFIREDLELLVKKCRESVAKLRESSDPKAKDMLARLNTSILRAMELLLIEKNISRYSPAEIKRS